MSSIKCQLHKLITVTLYGFQNSKSIVMHTIFRATFHHPSENNLFCFLDMTYCANSGQDIQLMASLNHSGKKSEQQGNRGQPASCQISSHIAVSASILGNVV